ncbi:hypothetical protein NKH56_30750 [Mesorhizobium sp. M1076]|uniref:hypothetical protein n=1 Tax=Mesorhizobium sp. M1076 TaxID=2957054 RepID=UPI003337156F
MVPALPWRCGHGSLGCDHPHNLTAASDEPGQGLGFGAAQRAVAACSTQRRQRYSSIGGVGPGPLAERIGVGCHLPRIDHDNRQASTLSKAATAKRDILPHSWHVEPASHDPLTFTCGKFSWAFVARIFGVLADTIRSRQVAMIARQR